MPLFSVIQKQQLLRSTESDYLYFPFKGQPLKLLSYMSGKEFNTAAEAREATWNILRAKYPLLAHVFLFDEKVARSDLGYHCIVIAAVLELNKYQLNANKSRTLESWLADHKSRAGQLNAALDQIKTTC